MRYRTKVTVVTGGKEYLPGSVLPEDISTMDLNFLKSKGFVIPTEMLSGAGDDDDFDDIFGLRKKIPETVKNLDEIRKIRSKKEVCTYAASIGLDLGQESDAKSLKELQEAVVNFQEETMAEWTKDDSREASFYEVV